MLQTSLRDMGHDGGRGLASRLFCRITLRDDKIHRLLLSAAVKRLYQVPASTSQLVIIRKPPLTVGAHDSTKRIRVQHFTDRPVDKRPEQHLGNGSVFCLHGAMLAGSNPS